MGLDAFNSSGSTSTSVPTGISDLSGKEVIDRLPHIREIEDNSIRKETIELSRKAPLYFWEVPASSSGKHNPICNKDNGLWAHTLMGAAALERLSETYRYQGFIDDQELDMARSAIILHDQMKNGDPEDPERSSTSYHDKHMGAVIEEETDLPQKVADAVRSHMGPWYDGPRPTTDLQQLVHYADMIASTKMVTPHIKGPVPDKLKDIGVKRYD